MARIRRAAGSEQSSCLLSRLVGECSADLLSVGLGEPLTPRHGKLIFCRSSSAQKRTAVMGTSPGRAANPEALGTRLGPVLGWLLGARGCCTLGTTCGLPHAELPLQWGWGGRGKVGEKVLWGRWGEGGWRRCSRGGGLSGEERRLEMKAREGRLLSPSSAFLTGFRSVLSGLKAQTGCASPQMGS